jgi:hypothetical protein
MKRIGVLAALAVMFSAVGASAVELSFLTGDVKVLRGNVSAGKLTPGFALKENDLVKTGKKSSAKVSYKDGSEIVLSENSSVKIGKISDKGDAPAIVIGGSVSTKFSKIAKDSSGTRKVYTPTTVCAVRGTEFKVIVSDTAASRVELTEGTLEVYNPEGGNTIQAGTSVEADIAAPPVKSDKASVDEAEWAAAKESEFDADVPERSSKFKKQNDGFASRNKSNAQKIEELKREIISEKEKKDSSSLEETGKKLDQQTEKIEDDYYQCGASTAAIDNILGRFGSDKRKMRDDFEKLKRESNKVKDQIQRNYQAIQAVRESYRKALEAIKAKYDSDKGKIKGDVDLQKVKPQINK